MFYKKQIFKINELKSLLVEENSCVSLVSTKRLLALPPCFLNDLKGGIFFLLNSTLKKYDQMLDGILIGYQNVKILMDDRTGLIPMGVAETRVNISVEFYVFQPKIGGFLKGIVNKKSNNHIGCLVHKYFNATILKPEDILFDNWICKHFNVDKTITFKVKDLDFSGLLPCIEGSVDDLNGFHDDSYKLIKLDIDKYDNETIKKNSHKKLLKSKDHWSVKIQKEQLSFTSNENQALETNLEHKDLKRKISSEFTDSEDEFCLDRKKKRRKNYKDFIDETKKNQGADQKESTEDILSSTQINVPRSKNSDSSPVSKKFGIDFCSPINCLSNMQEFLSESINLMSKPSKRKNLHPRANIFDDLDGKTTSHKSEVLALNNISLEPTEKWNRQHEIDLNQTVQDKINSVSSKDVKLNSKNGNINLKTQTQCDKRKKKKNFKDENLSLLYSKLMNDALNSINMSSEVLVENFGNMSSETHASTKVKKMEKHNKKKKKKQISQSISG